MKQYNFKNNNKKQLNVHYSSITVDVTGHMQQVSKGTKVELSCKLSHPDIKEGVWYKGEAPVQPSEMVEVGVNKQTQYLQIHGVERGDLDVYTYKIGTVSTSKYLIGMYYLTYYSSGI